MPNSVTKRRTRTALLATIAMLASVFVFPLTAQADVKPPESPADWSSCVAAATADAGFTDTSGSFAEASIDCIAHYGITTGTSATTYSPADVVSRWQMALFLTRAAGPAGITLPAPSDQGFTDIGGLSQATQDAINQIAALSISKGTSATTYSPDSAVTRQQMALFLTRFLAKAEPLLVNPADHPSGFTDTNGVSFEAHNAIEDAFDFGITTGTTATTFSPNASVTREQMAAFVARTLAHTNARPAGLSMQVSSTAISDGGNVDMHIALRDANHAPVVDGLVDVFQSLTKDVAAAFDANGKCTAKTSATFGGTKCLVELGEPTATGPDGNIDNNLVDGGVFAGSTTFWAWTGSAGASFDKDTTSAESVAVSVSAAPSYFLITNTVPANATTAVDGGAIVGNQVKYGTTVTFTFQLMDTDDKPFAKSGVKVTGDVGIWFDGVQSSQNNGVLIGTTDASGAFTVTYTYTDPEAAGGNTTMVDLHNFVSAPYTFDETKLANDENDTIWSDAASAATKLTASQSNKYTVASETGSGPAHTVQATLYDQYGLGMSGKQIAFDSNDLDGLNTGATRTTNSSGVATISYNRDDAGSSAETIVADWNAATLTGNVVHYWVIEEGVGPPPVVVPPAPFAVLVGDTANDTIVFFDTVDYLFVEYDANDQFNTGGGAVTLAAFEKALDDVGADTITYDYDPAPAGVSSFTEA